MVQYAISSLNKSAQNFIYEMKLDKNEDGYISSDNGELAELLSKYGAKDIQELAPDDAWSDYATGTAFITIGSGTAASSFVLAKQKYHPMWHRDAIRDYHQTRLNRHPLYEPKYTEAQIREVGDPKLAKHYREFNEAIEKSNQEAMKIREGITMRDSINRFSKAKAIRHNIGRGFAVAATIASLSIAAIGGWFIAKDHPKKDLS